MRVQMMSEGHVHFHPGERVWHVHYLYRGNVPGWTRAAADRLFAELMRQEGVRNWQRKMAFAAVRAFGVRYWKEVPPTVRASLR